MATYQVPGGGAEKPVVAVILGVDDPAASGPTPYVESRYPGANDPETAGRRPEFDPQIGGRTGRVEVADAVYDQDCEGRVVGGIPDASGELDIRCQCGRKSPADDHHRQEACNNST
jgi:hypothetical protein